MGYTVKATLAGLLTPAAAGTLSMGSVFQNDDADVINRINRINRIIFGHAIPENVIWR